jgi:hypothetical protein
MSGLVVNKKRKRSSKKRGILKKPEKIAPKKERPSHSVTGEWGLKEHFEKKDAGTCTNYGTLTENEEKIHEARTPVLDKNAPNREPRPLPKPTFSQHVQIRQRSLEDERGNSILGTETFGEESYCPLSKNTFFDELVNKIYKEEEFDEDFPRKKLASACDKGVSVLEAAEWVKPYLERKLAYLEENPDEKVGIGQRNLQHAHIYIIKRLLGIVQGLIDNEKVPKKSAAAASGKRGGGKRGLTDKTTLIF